MTLLSYPLAALRRLRTRWTLWRAGPRVSAGPDLHLGARCRLWAPQRIAFGRAVYVGKDVQIECNAEIGDFALIADRVALVGRQDHDFHVSGVPMRFTPQISPTMVAMPASVDPETNVVRIDSDVWLGFGSLVLTGVRIGRGAIVAAGAVVAADVAPYDIVAGNPARQIGRRFQSDAVIAEHERRIRLGEFRLSERGDAHWTVRPGT